MFKKVKNLGGREQPLLRPRFRVERVQVIVLIFFAWVAVLCTVQLYPVRPEPQIK
jgi:hypothetical protein